MKTCPSCGAQLDDEAVKCNSCGEILAITAEAGPAAIPSPDSGRKCPRCGQSSSLEEERCPYCGYSWSPPAADQERPPAPAAPPRPWVRYWARSWDYLLFTFASVFLAYLLYPATRPFLENTNEYVLSFLGIFFWNFMEAGLLSSWGTTPGKWLLSIAVRDHEGKKLSYGAALKRAFRIYVRGMGFGLPLVSVITNIVAFNILKNSGSTSWDRDQQINYHHGTIKIFKVILLIAFFIAVIMLNVMGKMR